MAQPLPAHTSAQTQNTNLFAPPKAFESVECREEGDRLPHPKYEALQRFKRRLLPKKLYMRYQATRYARRTEPELNVIPHLVPAGSTAIDGGANKGVWSWCLAQHCSSVHAFEPNPVMFDYLSHAVPSNVRVYRLALSDRLGSEVFFVPQSGGKVHHTRGSLFDTPAASESRSFEVEMICLDSLKFENLGFIKLDVEGAELSTLRGAQSTLDEHRPVVIAEAHGIGEHTPEELIDFMCERDYQPLVLNDDVLEYHGNCGAEIDVKRNLLFLPNRKRRAAT
ncbi:FkbM family methyltransferase [Congregibacter litoralis]